MMRARFLAMLAVATLAVWPQAAAAQLAVSRTPATAPDLGTTIRGSSATTFRITTTGAVTRLSGDAIRLSTGSVRAPTISVTCGVNFRLNNCSNRDIRVSITPVTGSGPAAITRFRVGALGGGADFETGSPPAEGATLTFEIDKLGRDTATFDLGMDVRINAGAPGGVHVYDYVVVVQIL